MAQTPEISASNLLQYLPGDVQLGSDVVVGAGRHRRRRRAGPHRLPLRHVAHRPLHHPHHQEDQVLIFLGWLA